VPNPHKTKRKRYIAANPTSENEKRKLQFLTVLGPPALLKTKELNTRSNQLSRLENGLPNPRWPAGGHNCAQLWVVLMWIPVCRQLGNTTQGLRIYSTKPGPLVGLISCVF